MKSREEIFNIYITQYATDKQVQTISNPLYVPNDQSIIDSLLKTESMYKQVLPEILLSNEEKDIVINKINSTLIIN